MFRSKKIGNFLVPGMHVHLVGIGGVSMRPLGLVLSGMGMDPDTYARKIAAVTVSDVAKAAKSLELHTDFFLKGGCQ